MKNPTYHVRVVPQTDLLSSQRSNLAKLCRTIEPPSMDLNLSTQRALAEHPPPPVPQAVTLFRDYMHVYPAPRGQHVQKWQLLLVDFYSPEKGAVGAD